MTISARYPHVPRCFPPVLSKWNLKTVYGFSAAVNNRASRWNPLENQCKNRWRRICYGVWTEDRGRLETPFSFASIWNFA